MGNSMRVVGRFLGHPLRHDQCMFGVDRRLHVVGRRKPVRHAHHVRFRFRVALQLL